MGGNCCGLARYQTVITLGEPNVKYAKYTQYARYQTVITLGELERDSKYAKYTQIQNILNIRTQYASKPDTLGELEPAKRYKIYSIYSLPDTAYRFKVMFFRNRFDSGRCCTFHDKHWQHMDSVRKGHVFRIFCRRRKKHKIIFPQCQGAEGSDGPIHASNRSPGPRPGGERSCRLPCHMELASHRGDSFTSFWSSLSSFTNNDCL